jgi:DNA-binding transcriptional LysR family regulator
MHQFFLMEFNLYPLWTFLRVFQAGSLTRAAEQLGISQPAVSAHLKGLEQRYGSPLLVRSARGMRPTPLGEAVHRQAQAVFGELQELERVVSGQSEGENLAIAASSTPGVYWLPGQLRSFRQKFPGLLTTYTLADSAVVQEWVLDYTVPLGVIGDLPVLSRPAPLHQEQVGSDTLMLMCDPANSLAPRLTVASRHLRDQTLILREPGSSTRAAALSMLDKQMDSFAHVLELNSNEAVKEAVLAGLGVAVLSSWTVRRECQAGLLCAVAPRQWSRQRPIYLVCRPERRLRGAAESLWKFLKTWRAGKSNPGRGAPTP